MRISISFLNRDLLLMATIYTLQQKLWSKNEMFGGYFLRFSCNMFSFKATKQHVVLKNKTTIY